jgi:hypothetical protein
MLLTGDDVRIYANYEDPFYATAKMGNAEMMKVLLAAGMHHHFLSFDSYFCRRFSTNRSIG